MTAPARFYQNVTTSEDAGGVVVRLDGNPVRTPQKTVLAVPERALAEAIAEEWRSQGKTVDPSSMPFTRLAFAALDATSPDAARLRDEILAYGKSDLLCYRAESPKALALRQQEAWDPLLEWAAERLGARLVTSTGVVYREQPPQGLAALARALEGRGSFELVALHGAVSLTGSLILGLALVEGHLGATEAFALSRLDEAFQSETWGRDAEAEARAGAQAAQLEAIETFLRLARP